MRWLPALTAVALALPVFLGDYGLFLASTVGVMGLYGAAYDLLYGYTGLLSLGHAVFFGVGGYGAAFAVEAGAGPFVGLAAAVVASSVAALVIGTVAVRVSSHAFVLVTFLTVLVANLVARTWTGITGGTNGFTVLAPPLELPFVGGFALYDPVVRYYFVVFFLLVSLAAMRRLVSSDVGLVLRMVRENEDRAESLGYDVNAYKLGGFAVSGTFAGLAGGLNVYVAEYVTASNFSISVTADPVVFSLVGGRGTLVGALLGSAVVTGVSDTVSELTTAYPLFIGALLVVVVVLEPDGIVGIARRLYDRLGGGGSD